MKLKEKLNKLITLIKVMITKVKVIELNPNTQYLWKLPNKESADTLKRVLNMARPSTSRNIKDILTTDEVDLIQGQLVTIPLYATFKSKTELLNTIRDALGSNFKNITNVYVDATGVTIKVFVPYKK
jgi:hypothetical protein